MQNHFDSVADSFASNNRIRFAKPALKFLLKLKNQRLHDRLNIRIQKLAHNPYPQNCKKLKAAQNIWEISQGSYRIWYEPCTALGEIKITWIGHHQDDYHKPNRLKRVS